MSPATTTEEGTGLSWRVHVLPFIGHQDLYRRFRLTESCDSDHNRTLIGEMPAVFESAEGTQSGHTSVHVFIETNPERPETAFTPGGVGIKDFADGTYNTVIVVAAGPETGEPWSKPGGLNIGNRPLEQLGDPGKSLCVGCADGTVRNLSMHKLDNAIFRAMLTHSGCEFGHTIDLMRAEKILVKVFRPFDELVSRIRKDKRFAVEYSTDGKSCLADLSREMRDSDRRSQHVRTALFIVGGQEQGCDAVRFCVSARAIGRSVICILDPDDQSTTAEVIKSGATALSTSLDVEQVMNKVVEACSKR